MNMNTTTTTAPETTPAPYIAPTNLYSFIGLSQLLCIRDALNGEERDFFKSMMRELVIRLETMPRTYETENTPTPEKFVYLHYFLGGCDWYIIERDAGAPDDERPGEQFQAFGYADIGFGPELGYISIRELIDNGAELDLYWTPRTVANVKKLNR